MPNLGRRPPRLPRLGFLKDNPLSWSSQFCEDQLFLLADRFILASKRMAGQLATRKWICENMLNRGPKQSSVFGGVLQGKSVFQAGQCRSALQADSATD